MDLRLEELKREAPLSGRGTWARVRWQGRDVCFLCGTLGAAFDAWQRRLGAISAADAYYAQQIGLAGVERVMDGLEDEIRATLAPSERLLPRKSPGYGDMPLGLSREIIDALDATKRLGVSLTAANLLVPSKTVTAICEIVRERE